MLLSSDNYLVIGGRDRQQNDIIIRRILRKGLKRKREKEREGDKKIDKL